MIIHTERALAYGASEQSLCERRPAPGTIAAHEAVIAQDELNFLLLLLAHVSRVVIGPFHPAMLRNVGTGRFAIGGHRSSALRFCFPEDISSDIGEIY